MLDFLATPFLLVAQIMLWTASFINGNGYVLMEVHEDDEDGNGTDYDQ